MKPARINMNNPRWQRAVQVLSRMGPGRKAIFNTLLADTQFADQEMRSYLLGAKLASKKLAQDRNVELSEKRLAQRKDLAEKELAYRQRRTDEDLDIREDRLDFAKEESDIANTMGYWNLGVSGLSGLTEWKEKRNKAKQLRSLANILENV